MYIYTYLHQQLFVLYACTCNSIREHIAERVFTLVAAVPKMVQYVMELMLRTNTSYIHYFSIVFGE